MKFQFKIQQYQTDAVENTVSVFAGQPSHDPASYRRDVGRERLELDETGYRNAEVELDAKQLLENIRQVQRESNIPLSDKLVTVGGMGVCHLDIEMETGTGKTYTYIKTMYELNARYGWSKFVIVVPSIAIREGVFKSFSMLEDHFMEHYGRKARYFVYDSGNLNLLDSFSSDGGIHVMIINTQAFAASLKEGGRSKESRIIYDRRDAFGSRRPIDVIAANRPIIIMDEPTRGIDIGAKRDIYDLMNELTNDGVSIIMVSSELPEVLGMSDRVMVIHEGRVAGILDRSDATPESIMTLATGGQ